MATAMLAECWKIKIGPKAQQQNKSIRNQRFNNSSDNASRSPYPESAAMQTPPHEITALLCAWKAGDGKAYEDLIKIVYPHLHRLAARQMRRESVGHTLSATALVHEAYLRLLDSNLDWRDRSHFLAVAAVVMRRVLVDHARSRKSGKRGSGALKVSLDEVSLAVSPTPANILDLDDALTRLAERDSRKARLVELRYFGGMSCEEAANVIGTSVATANRDLKFARAWLRQELSPSV